MEEKMLKEVCVENFTDIPNVIERGANRIELCDNLAESGTTPSIGVIKQSIRYCQERKIPVMVLIRPRGGNFVYSAIEKEMMFVDIAEAIKAGADGIVIGALTKTGLLDQEFLKEVATQARKAAVECTFHMAFDAIPEMHQEKAITLIEKIGYTRILTHGGPMEKDIFKHISHLQKLLSHSKQITIMPGGVLTRKNLETLKEALFFTEAHGTKLV